MACIKSGWTVPETELEPFKAVKEELFIHNEVLFRGDRVVIPAKLRKSILQQLHAGHPGTVRMKSIARSYVWWPGIDKEIEDMVRRCAGCQSDAPDAKETVSHFWLPPKENWSRLHIDFAGPF